MKKTFTLLTAMILSVTLYAYYGPSKLSISSTGNSNFRVMVDGNKYRSNNNTVMISDLSEGYHTIRIFQVKNGRGGFGFGNGYQLVYNSNLYLKPQYFVDIVINRFGKAFIDEQPLGKDYYNEEEDDWGDNRDNGNNVYGIRAMDDRTFDQFRLSLKNETFDNTKLSLAKQVIAENYFTTAQVKQIVQQFSFENNKLEIAKYAYKYTVDKGSYFLLNDAFSFSNSKEELMRYIQANK